jgi:hypothetical protein
MRSGGAGERGSGGAWGSVIKAVKEIEEEAEAEKEAEAEEEEDAELRRSKTRLRGLEVGFNLLRNRKKPRMPAREACVRKLRNRALEQPQSRGRERLKDKP